jgi:hypothetical protein
MKKTDILYFIDSAIVELKNSRQSMPTEDLTHIEGCVSLLEESKYVLSCIGNENYSLFYKTKCDSDPVAWLDSDGFPWSIEGREWRSVSDVYRPLYLRPNLKINDMD